VKIVLDTNVLVSALLWRGTPYQLLLKIRQQNTVQLYSSSLVGTTKLNGLDPEHYLRHVLTRVADHPINRVAEFLPWNVAAGLAAEREKIAVIGAQNVNPAQTGRLQTYRTQCDSWII